MQKNNKQVLLKYNTVERKSNEDNALMFKLKTSLRCFFAFALLFFPFMFYVPSCFEEGPRKAPELLYGWGLNRSRFVPLYVIPNNDTSLISGSQLCSEPSLLLVIIFSSVKNFLERNTIRETWGSYSSMYRIAFLLGATENATLQEAVEKESSLHNDIIQENFLDSYNNLTLKSIMMLKFVKNHCGKVKYFFKTDDDMFNYLPNALNLIRYLERIKKKPVLIGTLICKAKPIRESSNKWFSPSYMFQRSTYPNYLSGTGYLMDRSAAVKLYEAALDIPYFHLEDVFITGLCAEKAKIEPMHHPGFTYRTREMDPCLYKRSPDLISSHSVSKEQMKVLWTGVYNATCPETKSTPPTFFFLRNISQKTPPCR